MEININDYVCVKLTDDGKYIHHSNWHEVQKRIWAQGGDGWEYRPPVEDDDGWSTWQLWEVMQEFGQHIYLGGKVPFDTTIRIPNS